MGAPEVTSFLQSRAVMSWCCHERVQPRANVLLVLGRDDSCAGRGVSCNWGDAF